MKNSVGNVKEGVVLNENFFEWCNIKIPKKCDECSYLPLCQGGCRAGHLGKCEVICFLQKEIVDNIIKKICMDNYVLCN